MYSLYVLNDQSKCMLAFTKTSQKYSLIHTLYKYLYVCLYVDMVNSWKPNTDHIVTLSNKLSETFFVRISDFNETKGWGVIMFDFLRSLKK